MGEEDLVHGLEELDLLGADQAPFRNLCPVGSGFPHSPDEAHARFASWTSVKGNIMIAHVCRVLLVAVASGSCFAQTTIGLGSTGANVATDQGATNDQGTDGQIDGVNGWIPGAFGPGTAGRSVYDSVEVPAGGNGPCVTKSTRSFWYYIEGIDDEELVLRFGFVPDVFHSRSPYECPPCVGNAFSEIIADVSASLVVSTPSPNAVPVWFRITTKASVAREHESGGEDVTYITTARVDFRGGNVAFYDIDDPDFAPDDKIYSEGGDIGGSFMAADGDTIDIDIAAELFASLAPNHRGLCLNNPLPGNKDSSDALFVGSITISTRGPVPPSGQITPPPGYTANDAEMLFSVDIGSDAEMSDVLTPGNEWLDPGDLYTAFGPVPVVPFDGVRDDEAEIGAIPPPLPEPGIGGPAPLCSLLALTPDDRQRWLDVDASDLLDVDLLGVLAQPADPTNPVARFDSYSIFGPQYLAVSFDDDTALDYAQCDTPPGSPSPFTFGVYGGDATEDEVVAIELAFGPLGATVGTSIGLLSERQLHGALDPSPDALTQFAEDDDADALDVDWDAGFSRQWYFSVDHEATGGPMGLALDPGVIYQATTAGPIPVVTPRLYLGLLPGVDIDAFEFVFARSPVARRDALALLFSVDDDDPATPADESSGLDPRMIYISFLDGNSTPLLVSPLEEDVDGITAWWRPIGSVVFPKPPCLADTNHDGMLTPADFSAWIIAFNMMAPECDQNNDNLCTPADFSAWVANYNMGCP